VTLKNLEIFNSSYEGSEKYSLIGVLDSTKTSGGSRLLRYLLANPITNIAALNQRFAHISWYMDHWQEAGIIHNHLTHVSDIPKIISTLLYRKLLPSGFIKLRATLALFLEQSLMMQELRRG